MFWCINHCDNRSKVFVSIQDGATALTVACENGFTLIVEALCKAGANVDQTNAVS